MKDKLIKEIYELSPLQEGILFHYMQDQNSTTYFEQVIMCISGYVDVELLEKSFQTIIDRHDILRTVFSYRKTKKPYQVLMRQRKAVVNFEDYSGLGQSFKTLKIKQFIQNDKYNVFDISKDFLLKLSLLRKSENEYVLIWRFHHIILDAWSLQILYKELWLIYSSFLEQIPIKLPAVVPYSSYIKWQKKQLHHEAKAFWAGYLKNIDELSDLSKFYSHGNKKGNGFREKVESVLIEKVYSDNLRKVTKQFGITPNQFFQVIWGILLSKFLDSSDIMFGYVSSDRPQEIIGSENMVGLFLNTLPRRIQISGTDTINDLLFKIKEQGIEERNYNHLSYIDIQRLSGLNRSLFDHLFVFQNFPIENIKKSGFNQKQSSFEITQIISKEQTSYDLLVYFASIEDTFRFELKYNEETYDSNFISDVKGAFLEILNQASCEPSKFICSYEIVNKQARENILKQFNKPSNFPKDKTVIQFFEDIVRKNKNKIAVQYKDVCITYRMLDQRVNQIAKYLIELGVKSNDLVGLLLERSHEMISSILGVLKAGGGYLPIDPGYPDDRINFIIADANVSVLLTSNDNVRFKQKDLIICNTQNIKHNGVDIISSFKPGVLTDICYCIYTSGTTGFPKGVLVDNKNLIRLIINDDFQFDFTFNDVWSLFHSYCFDFSVWEIFGSLLHGSKLVVIPQKETKDFNKYLRLLEKESVTVLNSTPSVFYSLIEDCPVFNDLILNIRYVIFGGEKLYLKKLKSWVKKYPQSCLINMYGITETTVHVTYKKLESHDIQNDQSLIGAPIPTMNLYLMGQNQILLPPSVRGEICVGGEGVTRGYLNQIELTHSKFVQNPYKKNERLYLSGDLGQKNNESELVYLDRNDTQIKLRGFRIELGEIENQIINHEKVKAATVVFDNINQWICAYYTSEVVIDAIDFKKFLVNKLPSHFVPTHFIRIDNIPLNSIGKVDKRSLPEIKSDNTSINESQLSETEQKIFNVWVQVLNSKSFTIKSSFFNVGGDSIKAIRLIGSINKEFGKDLKIIDLYSHDTITSLAEFLAVENEGRNCSEKGEVLENILRIKQQVLDSNIYDNTIIEDVYPMSDIEKGMIFYSLQDIASSVYHDQFIYQRKFASFNLKIFQEALFKLVKKHDSLRTAYDINSFDMQVRIIYKEFDIDQYYFDISDKTKIQQKEFIEDKLLQDRKNPFKIAKAPLWRMMVFNIGYNNYCFVWTFHHAIIDGWSNASFITELNNTYLELKRNSSFNPGKLSISYKDFVIDQLTYKVNNKGLSDAFWKKELNNYQKLKFDTNPFEKRLEKKLRFTLGGILKEDLEKYAVNNKTTLKNITTAAFLYVLKMFSHTNDITTGLIIHNRPSCIDGEKVVGCFLNTIPFRFIFNKSQTWKSYIKSIDEKLLEYKKYEYSSFFDIVQSIGEKTTRENPITDSIFSVIDFHVFSDAVMSQDKNMDMVTSKNDYHDFSPYENVNTKFNAIIDLTLGNFDLNISYSTKFIDSNLVGKAGVYFKNILEQIVVNEDNIIDSSDLLLEEEKQILNSNIFSKSLPLQQKNIVNVFRDQVRANPDRISLVCRDQQISYLELDKRTDLVASYLVEKGIKKGDIVAIIVQKSFDTIESILSVLKTGAAYLPIESNLPVNRIDSILRDVQSKVIITNNFTIKSQKLSLTRLKSYNNPRNFNSREKNNNCFDYKKNNKLYVDLSERDIIILDEVISFTKDKSLNCVEQALSGDNNAYIMYTSGSTGMPKGTIISHENVLRTVCNTNYINISREDNILQLSNYAFDGSVFDIFGSLLNGAKLCLVEDMQVIQTELLQEQINRHQISIFFATTALFNNLIKTLTNIRSVQKIMFGGEKVSYETTKQALEKLGKGRIQHMYGPTEATVYSTFYPVDNIDSDADTIPIGKPIDFSSVYILDQNINRLPVGVTGEMYIGGDRLSKGYLNNVELTAKHFIENGHGELIYKTGDFGKFLSNGNVEFVKRKDNQIKLRGYRIELAEIEKVLVSHSKIRESIVILVSNNELNKYLCAYIVALDIEEKELRKYLLSYLPEYMIPSRYVFIDKFPLNANGKIDRKQLPKPQGNLSKPLSYSSNLIDDKLKSIWAEILGIDYNMLSPSSDFFELGGHSLMATFLISRISKEFNVKMSLNELFTDSTLSNISKIISSSSNTYKLEMRKAEKSEFYKAFPSQKRLFSIQNLSPSNKDYNIPVIITFKNKLDITRFEYAFNKLIERHENLRTSFFIYNNEVVFKVLGKLEFYYKRHCVDQDEQNKIIENFIQPFDLLKAPLFRVEVIEKGNCDIVLFDIHHIIADGLALKIFFEEFMDLYFNRIEKEGTIQFKDYAQWWWRSNVRGEKYNKQKAYWINNFNTQFVELNLPTDFPMKRECLQNGKIYRYEFGKALSNNLIELARKEKVTMFMLLLSLINILLSKICGQEIVNVGTGSSGRLVHHTKSLVGMLVNTITLQNKISRDISFKKFIQQVKNNTVNCFENQDFQYEDLVSWLNIKNRDKRIPVFDVHFSMDDIVITDLQNINNEIEFSSFNEKYLKFPLGITAHDSSDNIVLDVLYPTNVFKESTIMQMMHYFTNITKVIIENNDIEIGEIQLLEEKQQSNISIQEFDF